MSANRQRIASAIRNLALTPEERRALLGDSKNKGGKAASAGVGTSEAEESRLCCDGSTSGNANPGTGARDPDADGAGQDGLDSSDPAKLSSGDGTLSGVTDCATGEPICFDGAGFVPPDGWDEPDEPGPLQGWQEGVYWQGGTSTDPADWGNYLTCSQARGAALSACTPRFPVAECPDSSVGLYECEGGGSVPFGWRSRSCASDYDAEMCQYTEENPPTATEWPSDGCTNLAIKDGKIVGSKYDPDQDGSYSAPRDSIDLCDPDNGARITLRASGQSDWKTIDAISSGDGYLYRNGKQIARVSGDEFTDPNV